MFFNSIQFFIFFFAVYSLFWLAPKKLKWLVFLLASWVFYASFGPKYLPILLFLVAVDFFAARIIAAAKSDRKKKIFLALALAVNLLMLFFFKYANFLIVTLNDLFFDGRLSFLSVALPIGISFYTFQGISYLVDVYRGVAPAEKNPGIFALYKSAFPQLVAGPIERANNMIPQLKNSLGVFAGNLKEGLLLVAVGLVKKMAIADNLGVIVDKIYGAYADSSGFMLGLATLFFAFQIYCDFGGYVDIARGLGKLMGINFVLNFNKPYFSASITEFWRCWHISLSEWVRDYIYIPLGGNRKGRIRQYFNLLATMSIMGLWHGANWTFVIWGLYHGLLLTFDKIFGGAKAIMLLPKTVRVGATFAAVALGWIFFRSNSLSQAFGIIGKIFSSSLFAKEALDGDMFLGAWLIGFLFFFEFLDLRFGFARKILNLNSLYFAVFLTILMYTLELFGMKGSSSFIYFQF